MTRFVDVVARLVLGAVMALVVISYACVYGPAVRPGQLRAGAPTDVGGTIATYATDAIVLAMSGGEHRKVIVTPATTIVRIDTPATAAELRPGKFVAVQVESWRWDGSVVARGIAVW
jgi:hypothetical protein